jgi:hypothetical protein
MIALLAVLFSFGASSFATSCVWGKKFKTHKVCGLVRDRYGAEMPDAKVSIERPRTEDVVGQTQTRHDGSFDLTEAAPGDYIIRVRYRGFVDATQVFRLAHPDKRQSCKQPIQVTMDVAGRCSAVENAWKK